MKKLMMLFALGVCSSLVLFAQHEEHKDMCCQQKKGSCKMMDCCMMQGGKMMCMTNGKMLPMEKDMIMKDSTTVKTDGTVIKKNGETMKMKEGMCCDMMGTMHESCGEHKDKKKEKHGAVYTCPMHPEVISAKPGNCPKCGMPLEKQE